VTAAALSSSGSYLAFGDADGNHHVWSSTDPGAEAEEGLTFNGFGGVLPDYPDELLPLPKIDWSPTTPLNSIGMPYYDTSLLSNLPSAAYCPVASSPFFNPPSELPLAVLSAARQVDFVGYAQTPRELKGTRNRVPGPSKARAGKNGLKQRRVSEPRFRSEREKEARWGGGAGKEKEGEGLAGGSGSALESTAEDEGGRGMNKYRKVEIKYSKFGASLSAHSSTTSSQLTGRLDPCTPGIEDFDFSFYNATRYSGLETHIANSYTNALLQALHYTLPFRQIAKSHLSAPCPREHCLFCEAGFLFRMLEDAQGVNCQASNFSRAFGGTQQGACVVSASRNFSPIAR
jgi:PAB-dependent poly(A)-specific ribonuclease subunit 2